MSTTEIDACREAFEAWESQNGKFTHIFDRDQDGDYQYYQTDEKWYVWQAAWHARKPLTDEQIDKALNDAGVPEYLGCHTTDVLAARAIERAHGIGTAEKG